MGGFKKFIVIFLNLLLILQISSLGLFWKPQKAYAADLTQITATPANVTAGATTDYTFAFKTSTAVPANGKITIQFPAGFNVSGATFSSWTGFNGGQSVSVDGQVITITRDNTGSSSAAGNKTIVLSNIINTATTGNNYQVTITTKTAAGATLDGPTNSIYFQIFSSHSETNINGIYYLRNNVQTHYQNRGNSGTGNDIGSLLRTPPTTDEYRTCGAWIQFYLDENGTYTQTNTLNNIYYHLWWQAEDNQGTLGYDETGSYDTTLTESFDITSGTAITKVDSLYLSTSKQILGSPRSITGNAIYNFTIKLAAAYPASFSGPNQYSFVIFNLADDATLQGQDSDSDGLNDYAELFTYYTNPYDSDTDNDGYNDKYEVDNSMNPNDPQRAPVFGRNLLKQFNGSAEGDYFGYSVSSIGDQDGDGKEDVLVGAYGADPGGLSDAGSAYIYSSSSGNLLKQFNGSSEGDYFGYSVSSIGDQDGDGKEDVLVGAYGADPGGLSSAGSAYIYSSSSGNLLKRFNGRTSGDSFGSSVSSIGDQDGDGKEDVLVGAYAADPGGLFYAGSAYIYLSVGSIANQTWPKGSSLANAFDLDDYFSDPNNSTIPNPNQTITYSVSGNSRITVSIDSSTHQVSFSQPLWWAGSEIVTFRATDPYGLYVDSNAITLTVTGASDTTPPATSITLGPSFPDGDNGYYKTAPTITLSATDSESGVSKTYYKWDNNSYQEYSAAFTAPEGEHTLYYYSTDNACNTEAEKSTTIKVASSYRFSQTQAPYSSYRNNPKIVIILQSILKKLGYFPSYIKSTGYYGRLTKWAVYLYQKAKGIVKSWWSWGAGWFGPKTKKALNEDIQRGRISPSIIESSIAESQTRVKFLHDLYIGSSGYYVVKLQQRLAEEGYLNQGYITGYFGSITKQAVLKYQKAHKIDLSRGGAGRVGPRTRAVLNSY